LYNLKPNENAWIDGEQIAYLSGYGNGIGVQGAESEDVVATLEEQDSEAAV